MPTKRREPLCPLEALPLKGWHPVPPRRALPLLPRSYGLMRRSQILYSASLSLFLVVSAGCCQPLLEEGPSRRYLCIPCAGAWSHTPRCHLCALARFLQRCNGLAQGARGSAHRILPAKQLQRDVQISRLQSFHDVQAPTLARPPGCSHRRSLPLGGRAVYAAHTPVGYLPQVAASLHARHGQLAWLDSHQLECSLVGCSRTHWTTDEVS